MITIDDRATMAPMQRLNLHVSMGYSQNSDDSLRAKVCNF